MTAIGYLRRRTIERSVRGYLVWVGRAVGWWTLVYLAFWLVVFAIAGVETLVRLPQPLPSAVPVVLGVAVTLAFAALAGAGRAPPVIVDRRDLYRLALAPTVPFDVLRARLNVLAGLRLAAGAAVGAIWSVLAPPLFHLSAPWAAAGLALLAVAHADVAWLRYAGFRRDDADGRAARAAAAWLIVVAVGLGAVGALVAYAAPGAPTWATALDLAGPLRGDQPLALVVPLGLALMARAAVRRSLQRVWPPRFAAQSLVLTQLQAMRTLQLLAGVAGMAPSAREVDAGERARLLAALHDRPGATRPRRSLRPPALQAPPWRAVAWRTASALVRRPAGAQLRLVVLTVLAVAGLLAAAGTLTVPAPTTAGAGVATEVPADPLGAAFVVAIGTFAAAWLLARTTAALLGPSLAQATLPVDPAERTRGRLTPATLVFALAAVPATALLSGLATVSAVPAPLAGDVFGLVLATLALAACVVTALEKYATWSGAVASGWEATVVAALIAAAPALLLGMFGLPTWVVPVQVGVAIVLWWLPV